MPETEEKKPNTSIIKPKRVDVGKAATAILIADPFLYKLAKNSGLLERPCCKLLDLVCIHRNTKSMENTIIAGPVFGSAITGLIAETLICSGIKYILQIGTCGDLTGNSEIGNILIGKRAFFADKTISGGTGTGTNYKYFSSKVINNAIPRVLSGTFNLKESGLIASTDFPFMETPEKIAKLVEDGALYIEMEFATLLMIAANRNVHASGIFVVSDQIHENSRISGYSSSEFKRICRNLISKITQSPLPVR